MLNCDAILNANDTKQEPVAVPEWGEGEVVFVPVLSLAELDELAKLQQNKTENNNALVACQVIRDENGNRIFTDDKAPALAKKSGKVILRIIERFNEINGFADNAAENASKN